MSFSISIKGGVFVPQRFGSIGQYIRDRSGKEDGTGFAQAASHPNPPYEPDGESEQNVDLLQIGSLKLIGVKPELNGVTAKEISGYDQMVKVVTLWNGGAKYMADAASYDRITYEAQNSPFMKGAAELLAKCAGELLAEVDS